MSLTTKYRSELNKYRHGLGPMLEEVANVLIDPGKVYYVDTLNGSDANDGLTWDTALATMEYALNTVAADHDTFFVKGLIEEQVLAPQDVFDVKIIGVDSPRHATEDGTVVSTPPHWTFETDNTTPLLELREQGWHIENILFAAPAAGAAIQLTRAETDEYRDASHARIINNIFASGKDGVVDSGGHYNLQFYGNEFRALTGHCIKNITGAGIALPQNWKVVGNRFLGFTNGIYTGAKHFIVKDNFFTAGGTPNTTTVLDLVGTGVSGEGSNFIVDNIFQTATANFNSPDIKGNATDVWHNRSIDGTDLSSTSMGYEVGTPA
jgi:hypothetical protein